VAGRAGGCDDHAAGDAHDPRGQRRHAGTCTVTADVTSSIGGVHTNTIAAGALQTSNGNNASPASANLTVNAWRRR
jgi:hypothetical protein